MIFEHLSYSLRAVSNVQRIQVSAAVDLPFEQQRTISTMWVFTFLSDLSSFDIDII